MSRNGSANPFEGFPGHTAEPEPDVDESRDRARAQRKAQIAQTEGLRLVAHSPPRQRDDDHHRTPSALASGASVAPLTFPSWAA